jgi:hypothetical protein
MQTTLIKKRSSKLFITIMLLGLLSGCVKHPYFPPSAGEESADVVFGWYKFIARIQLNTTPPPVALQNFRDLGFIGVGLYEAVQPGIKGAISLSSKLYQMPSMPEAEADKLYSWSASANAALASMFKQFLGGLTDANKTSIDSLENAYKDQFRLRIPEAVITRSQTFGRSIADAIHNWSTTDNFTTSSVGYDLPVCPSCWVLVPPFTSPVGAFIGNSRPFLAYTLTATTPPMPFPYSEDPSSDFYKQAKNVYDIGIALTPEQKLIGKWFADFGGPGVGVAGGAHILSIATSVLEGKNAKLGQAAQIYAKISIAFKDDPVVIWRGKFHFNLLRPVTYINRLIDPTWTTLIPTPPYPDYPSGLVSLYSSSLQVLKREYGDIPITDNTYGWRGDAPRQYPSITELVKEAGFSRVLDGIHYQFTQDITIALAKEIGNQIADIDLVRSQHH